MKIIAADKNKKKIIALIQLGIKRRDIPQVATPLLENFLGLKSASKSKKPHFINKYYEGHLFQTWSDGWLFGKDMIGILNDDFIYQLQARLFRDSNLYEFQSLVFDSVEISMTGHNSFSIKFRSQVYRFEQGPDGIYVKNSDKNLHVINQINLLILMTELNNEVCRIELREIDYSGLCINDLIIYNLVGHPLLDDEYLVYKFNERGKVIDVFTFVSKKTADKYVLEHHKLMVNPITL